MSPKFADLLRRMDLFARLPDRELQDIGRLLNERRFRSGQVVFRQGDKSDSLYIVAAGRVRISASDHAGREKVIAFLGTGEVVGELGLLSGEPRSATAVASTDAQLLQLRKSDFDVLVAKHVDLMRDVARTVFHRGEATEQRSREQASSNTALRQGLVTTLFSPRGGAGTTTIATNIAIALAQRAPDRVVLWDLNVVFGHVPILLDLVPRTSLAAISARSLAQMDRENLEFYLTTHAESSLRVLSSVVRPEDGELVTAEHVIAAIELLRSQFAHVVIDLGRSFSEVNISAIEATHNLLIVCTPEPVGIRGVAATQRIVREVLQLPGDPLQYLLNHTSPSAPCSDEQVERALSARLIESIPFGGDAPARAALEGRPLVMRWPNTATSKSIHRVTDRLAQQIEEAGALKSPAFLTIS